MGWKPRLQRVSQADSGRVKRAWEDKVWPAAAVALGPDHCYPKVLEILKVVMNLNYQSVLEKLQKGYKRTISISCVYLNCTFKKPASQETPL